MPPALDVGVRRWAGAEITPASRRTFGSLGKPRAEPACLHAGAIVSEGEGRRAPPPPGRRRSEAGALWMPRSVMSGLTGSGRRKHLLNSVLQARLPHGEAA